MVIVTLPPLKVGAPATVRLHVRDEIPAAGDSLTSVVEHGRQTAIRS